MKVWLAREGRRVSRKRVQRLMRTTALRARRYDSTWYIPGTIHGVDYNPMDGPDLSSQSAIYPPARPTLPPLFTAGRAVRDVFQAMLMACTAPLTQDENSMTARGQAVDPAAHLRTVIDTATNVDAIRERMPTLPTSPLH